MIVPDSCVSLTPHAHDGSWISRAGSEGSNILLSALVFPGGREAALKEIIEAQDELILSKSIVDELLRILAKRVATPFTPAALRRTRMVGLGFRRLVGRFLISVPAYCSGRRTS